MLTEIEEKETLSASAQLHSIQSDNRRQPPNRGRFNSQYQRNRGRPSRQRSEQKRGYTDQFCKLCHVAGKALPVCRSHDLINCLALSDRHRKRIIASLGALTIKEEEEETDVNKPLGAIRVEGWDEGDDTADISNSDN